MFTPPPLISIQDEASDQRAHRPPMPPSTYSSTTTVSAIMPRAGPISARCGGVSAARKDELFFDPPPLRRANSGDAVGEVVDMYYFQEPRRLSGSWH